MVKATFFINFAVSFDNNYLKVLMKRISTFVASAAIAAIGLQASAFEFNPQVKMPSKGVPEISTEVIWEAPEGELSWLNRSCDGFVVRAYDATHGPIYGSVVQRVNSEDGYVYLNHMASEYPVDTWIKFEKTDNTLVMDGIQAIYIDYDYENDVEYYVYLAPMKVVIDEDNRGTFVVEEDSKFVFNETEDGSLISADPEMLLGICALLVNDEGEERWNWLGFGDRDITMVPADGQIVELPAGLETENWVWSDDSESAFVKVAVDGEDFYINGMDRSLPEAWIKGKISDGKVTFPSGQYLGVDMDIFYYSYFSGAEFTDGEDEDGNPILVASLADSSVFEYDAENKRLTMERGYMINSTADKLFPLYFYDMVDIAAQHRDPEAAPDAPYDIVYNESDWGNNVWFMLPNVDVNGELLIESNLYYEIYVDGELLSFTIYDEDFNEVKMTRIPYNYDDQMDFWVAGEDHTVYFDAPVVNNVGIRSVYINENGEEIYSEMGYWGNVGVDSIESGKNIVSEKYYDLQGRELRGSNAGIVVKVTTYSDGSVVREKTVIK